MSSKRVPSHTGDYIVLESSHVVRFARTRRSNCDGKFRLSSLVSTRSDCTPAFSPPFDSDMSDQRGVPRGEATTSLPVVSLACLAPIVAEMLASKRVNSSLSVPDGVVRAWLESSLKNEIVSCAAQLIDAFQTVGFLYVKDYAIPPQLEADLDRMSRTFFRLPLEEKQRIAMKHGGVAWRGFFPVGGELTSGRPDIKEGLYFGQERTSDDPRVAKRVPLFGANLFPEEPAELRDIVLSYMDHCEALGQGMLMLVAIGLHLDATFFLRGFCSDPTCLFRIFHYPPPMTLDDERLRDATLWGVGEHTDYGLLTLLKQDDVGGLEVRHIDGSWVAAQPIPGTLVINIGDMMEAMTQGLLCSTPHRVRNRGGPDAMRMSFPFFFDPGFHATIAQLPLSEDQVQAAQRAVSERREANRERWDNVGISVRVDGTYGDYLIGKVGKVFPDLAAANQVVHSGPS